MIYDFKFLNFRFLFDKDFIRPSFVFSYTRMFVCVNYVQKAHVKVHVKRVANHIAQTLLCR